MLRAGHPFEEVADSTWVVRDRESHGAHVVVKLVEGIVLFRTKVIDLDDSECADLLSGYVRDSPAVWHEDIGED